MNLSTVDKSDIYCDIKWLSFFVKELASFGRSRILAVSG